MTVGGVDTYYDYEEKQWKSRRLGGGPIRRGPVCPAPRAAEQSAHPVRPVPDRDHQVVPKHTLN
ncbi:hypothetical protein GCM10010522_44330 [Kribbella solani]|uniref:Uncharacterized protein n=1 Tax=Kribbella solani TaxID=236067 RepID=A0A841DYG4_9ACTN|nr:hypothetical protein [Kribbella solani]